MFLGKDFRNKKIKVEFAQRKQGSFGGDRGGGGGGFRGKCWERMSTKLTY